jgi:cytochrome d ubiquinol oxidase subunit II
MLLPVLPRSERERGTLFESIGPVWDGNEVWLVVAGGATFAAFPAWYATMFSGFYIVILLILVCLIVRVVSFEWREKRDSPGWRSTWMWANTIGSLGAAFLWGLALTNLLHGVPLNSSHAFSGTFWNLFNGYTVLGGIAVVLVFAFHGTTYLGIRTEGELRTRAAAAGRRIAVPAIVVGFGFLVWTVVVAHQRNERGVLAPAIVAAVAAAALILGAACAIADREGWAFAMTSVGAVAIVATLFTGLYPRVLVSHPDFTNSLTISNAASGHYTLEVITIVAAILTPLVVLYQGWTYYVFRKRVGGEPVQTPAAALSNSRGTAPG